MRFHLKKIRIALVIDTVILPMPHFSVSVTDERWQQLSSS